MEARIQTEALPAVGWSVLLAVGPFVRYALLINHTLELSEHRILKAI